MLGVNTSDGQTLRIAYDDKNLGKGYLGVRYQVKKGKGFSTRSYELHSPHKRASSHNAWHWQRIQWSYHNNKWSISSKKSKHWTLRGKKYDKI